MKFYKLHINDFNLEVNYIKINDKRLMQIKEACSMSHFQFLDKSVLEIEIESDSGNIWQDFIVYENSVPIISDRVKDFFESQNLDYLFYKKLVFKQSDLGCEEIYWIALPPRIDCLNKTKSKIDFLNKATFMTVNENNIGRYKIFKLTGVVNNTIVITENFAKLLKSKNFEGVEIYELNEDE